MGRSYDTGISLIFKQFSANNALIHLFQHDFKPVPDVVGVGPQFQRRWQSTRQAWSAHPALSRNMAWEILVVGCGSGRWSVFG